MPTTIQSDEPAISNSRPPPTHLDLEKIHRIHVELAASYVGDPRRRRIGGFVMSTATAFVWASRIYGQTIYPVYENCLAKQIVLRKIRKYKVDFRNVGEVPEIEWMVVTQIAPFKGRVGMDPATIPQFVGGEREAIARTLLAEEGIPESDIEFRTMLY